VAQAWSFVAAGTQATGANPVPGMPTGWAAGDMLVIVAVCSTVSFSATPPTGWTEAARYTTGTPRMAVWYRKAVAGDTAPTLTNSGTSSAAVMLAYRTAGIFDVVSSVAAASGTSLATGTVSTAVADELLMSIWGCGVSPASTTTITKDAAVTTRTSKTASTTVCAFNVCDENAATPGTTTSRTATTNRTVSLNALQLAFKLATYAPPMMAPASLMAPLLCM